VGEQSIRYGLITLSVGAWLFYIIRDIRDHFFQIYLFLVGLLVAFEIDQAGANLLYQGITLGDATQFIFILMAPVVTFLVVFRENKEALLTTPLDLLILSMCVALAIVAPQFEMTFNLPALVSKAIIIFLSIKILMNRTTQLGRTACGSVLASLLLLVVRSF
jgi:hypothetical protein